MAGGSDDDEIFDTRHDLGGGDIGYDHLLAVVEKGVFVELNPGFVDAVAREGVADPFGDHDGDHDGEHVVEGAGELEHDDDDGDGHASDAGEGGGGTDDGVSARGDAGDVRLARGKDEEARVISDPDLHDDANSATGERADGHGREDDASGDLQAEGDGGEEEAQDGSEDQQHDGASRGGARLAQADLVVEHLGTLGEKIGYELRRLRLHVEVGIVDERRQEGHGEDLHDRAGKPGRGLAPAGDGHVELDEEAAVDALDSRDVVS
ncbi:hypothetical protein G7046_g10162 [Stylonectria norvegica]|nr:hypothetical protein G7046_g10162 [Stylonectria norvegica]